MRLLVPILIAEASDCSSQSALTSFGRPRWSATPLLVTSSHGPGGRVAFAGAGAPGAREPRPGWARRLRGRRRQLAVGVDPPGLVREHPDAGRLRAAGDLDRERLAERDRPGRVTAREIDGTERDALLVARDV